MAKESTFAVDDRSCNKKHFYFTDIAMKLRNVQRVSKTGSLRDSAQVNAFDKQML
jgi:hypothetical protein